MAEWVSVKDKLPEFNEKVLLSTGYDYSVGYLSHIDIDGPSFYCESDIGDYYRNTSHWMNVEIPKNTK